ncbi:head GIN domain-containing protein [Larkinella terrae]|nr:head GIN domain-containing protein [Larkinella terrae]
MKRFVILLAAFTAILPFLSSCNREDVGPLQEGEKAFLLTGFDQLELGSGFDVSVEAGPGFKIMAKGDQRNLDELDVVVRNGTLTAKYRTNKNRKYTTGFTITMPTLRGANFSGGVHATVKGFTNLSDLNIELSGGTHGTWEVIATRTNAIVSGGSKLQLTESKVTTGDDAGTSLINQLSVDVSGGSHVEAFDYAARDVTVKASGGSHANIRANKSLTAEASGASKINYKGNPANVNQSATGGSKVEPN